MTTTFDAKLVETLSREQSALRGALPTDADRNLPIAKTAIECLFYKNLSVQSFLRLLDRNGQPLRASQVDVSAIDVYWRYGTSAINVITRAAGWNQKADPSWQFSGLNQFQIVLYQPGGDAFGIDSDDQDMPQTVNTNPGLDILFGVNDVVNTYYDNTGAFSIYLCITRR